YFKKKAEEKRRAAYYENLQDTAIIPISKAITRAIFKIILNIRFISFKVIIISMNLKYFLRLYASQGYILRKAIYFVRLYTV
ncbi:MAG: hypothetical protein AAGK97_13030, partial [Bacteroidota bacterium]